jgi:hypothetical protein
MAQGDDMRIIMAVAGVLLAVVSAGAQRLPEISDLVWRPSQRVQIPTFLQKACWEDYVKYVDANGGTSWKLFYPACVERRWKQR